MRADGRWIECRWCQRLFVLCRGCDHGNAYCDDPCRRAAQREANDRHQRSDEGRVPAVRLDKHASPENAAFDELDRGDLVRLEGLERRGDGLRVGKQSHVDRG